MSVVIKIKNGAGKSTLLKLLSRVGNGSHNRDHQSKRPYCQLAGSWYRVSSGVSGSENIYQNITIMSMRKNEFACKLSKMIGLVIEMSHSGQVIHKLN
jgi:ABC-type polysaccharide/polyol phosphate transport system ATPase subunit